MKKVIVKEIKQNKNELILLGVLESLSTSYYYNKEIKIQIENLIRLLEEKIYNEFLDYDITKDELFERVTFYLDKKNN